MAVSFSEACREILDQLEERQAGAWEDARAKYLAARSCNLGLCGKLDVVEFEAKAAQGATPAETREKRDKARLRLESERETLTQTWKQAARLVEHIAIAKDVLTRLREGRL